MNLLKETYKLMPQSLKEHVRRLRSTEYRIIKPTEECFEKLCRIKPETWDKAYYPPLYGHTKEKYMEILTPEQYAIQINNAYISADSDVVITDDGVYWDKYNEEEFMTFAMPCDGNLAYYNNDKIGVVRSSRIEKIEGKTLSLLGVWSFHWCHFFLQFATKLFSAGENGLLDDDITILVHSKADSNIRQLVNDYLRSYPKAHVKYAEPKVEYLCESVICIPTGFPNFNVGKFRLDYPYINPQYSIDRIFKYAVDPYIEKIKDNPMRFKKIFLTRKASASSQRTLTNYDEIHKYFKSIGFVDIEGAGMSLEEKADIFYHAKEIVGLQGASLQNLMFCNGARCLVFTNYRFVDDTCGYTQVRNKISTWMNISGQDLNSDYHSGYTIPLEKIKKAYEEYIKQ